MIDTINYKMKPDTTRYNIGVFLLTFHTRSDGLSLGEAFCQDFDLMDTTISKACNVTALQNITRNYF